ncbi:C-C chemokine receptor type 8-like [Dermochelys coriacea]|uniref:C-C chemokine receptor type 8-like n=1 Tax=Dermochelys coriacea TaxID=27794 RepID=UPI0018E7F3F5|nr:C-C chemokine receptor type 8-like [Dermochelys coriacea]
MMNYSTESNLLSTFYDDYPDLGSVCSTQNIKTFGSVFFPILYCVVFVFGLVGNSLVICVLMVCKKLTSMTDVYLLNLAISDLLFVFSLPFLAHYASGQWTFGNVMCKTVCGVYYIGFYSSIFFITLMSIDRYLAIVHAVHAQKVRTTMLSIVISLAVWSVAIFASIPSIFFIQELNENDIVKCAPYYQDNRTAWKLLTNSKVNVLGLLIPLGILIFCYSHILKNLQRCMNRNKYKAMKLVFVVVVVFFLFWVPFNIALFLDSLRSLHIIDDCETSKSLDLALQVTETISFIHCCLNPVIYAFVGEKFKKYLHEMFRKHARFLLICKDHNVFQSHYSTSFMRTQSSHSSVIDPVM